MSAAVEKDSAVPSRVFREYDIRGTAGEEIGQGFAYCGMILAARHDPGDENGFRIAMHKTTVYGDTIQQLKRAMLRIRDAEGAPKKFSRKTNLLPGPGIPQPSSRPGRSENLRDLIGKVRAEAESESGLQTIKRQIEKALKFASADLSVAW